MSNQLIGIPDYETGDVYCTMPLETKEQKVAYYNATTSPDYRLADCINKKIKIKYLICEPVIVSNEDGTRQDGYSPRCIIIDDEGFSYSCVSTGIFNSLSKLVAIFGDFEDEPLEVEIRQITKNKNKILTLALV